MAESIKNTFSIYRQATFKVFTRGGLIISILIIILFTGLNLFEFDLDILGVRITIADFVPINILIAFIVAFYTASMWYLIGIRLAPRVGEFLTEKKIMNIIITKGDMHYFEKTIEEERKVVPGLVIGKFINLLISWLAVSAFVIGLFYLPIAGLIFGEPSQQQQILNFFEPDPFVNPILYLFKLLLIFIISPLLLSIIIPVPWMLIDTKLKAYNSKIKLNFLVGRQLQARLSVLFAIGGLVTLFLSFISRLDLLLEFALLFISFVILFIGLPSAIIVMLYNMLFQVEYYEAFLRGIPVPYGTTTIEMEQKFTPKSDLLEEDKNSAPSDVEKNTAADKDNFDE